jgi:hypothetical protein
MNRPLTTVERLQQQQTVLTETTAGSLKRNIPLLDISPNANVHPLQVSFNDLYPRKRQNSGPGRSMSENEGGHWRARFTEGYPTPPSVSGITTEITSKERSVPRVVTEFSLVMSIVPIADASVILDGNFQKLSSTHMNRKG